MKIGTQVKVVTCLSGLGPHEFEIGEVVTRVYAVYDSHRSVAFESECNGVWYMRPDEYELISDYESEPDWSSSETLLSEP